MTESTFEKILESSLKEKKHSKNIEEALRHLDAARAALNREGLDEIGNKIFDITLKLAL
jgi:hypothetical protein